MNALGCAFNTWDLVKWVLHSFTLSLDDSRVISAKMVGRLLSYSQELLGLRLCCAFGGGFGVSRQ